MIATHPLARPRIASEPLTIGECIRITCAGRQMAALANGKKWQDVLSLSLEIAHQRGLDPAANMRTWLNQGDLIESVADCVRTAERDPYVWVDPFERSAWRRGAV